MKRSVNVSRRTVLVLCVGLLSVCLVVLSGAFLWRLQVCNTAVAQSNALTASRYCGAEQAQLVQALEWHREAQLLQASEAYARLRAASATQIWEVARFNLAGVYLQRAVALERDPSSDGREVLIELAKAHYRALLAADPGDRAAAHNLALALGLLPDVLARASPESDQLPEHAPQAPVTAAGRQALP